MKLHILSLRRRRSATDKKPPKQLNHLESLIGAKTTVSRAMVPLGIMTEINLKEEIESVEIVELNEVEDLIGSHSLIYVLDRYTKQVFKLSKGENVNDDDTESDENDDTSSKVWKVENIHFGSKDEKSSASLRVLKMSTYTEHALFLLEDIHNGETYLYGRGNNAYSRLSSKENVDLSKPVFSPHIQLQNKRSRITHVGCCFSFSVCIVNNTDVHLSGQDWINNSNTGYHDWLNRAHVCTKPVKSLHCGNFHFIILLVDGSICVAGSHSSKQLILRHVTPFQEIPTSVQAGIYANLGTNCSLVTSPTNTYHFFGGSPFTVEGDDRRVKSPLITDHDSKEFPYDEVFLGREYGAFHFKHNQLLYLLGNVSGMAYNHIVRYSSLFSTQPQIVTLPNRIVFFLNRPHSAFHKKLLEKAYMENQHTISDVLIVAYH
ncbi:hypothetical protein FDP41_001904 [Naegleria fowleri]|uniref:Uncharacterized protein n=1 Tax=Naegleria fowleri TaxID=5763 RepID=A0A6A5BWZ2_NAEFO|nr:uncharacterized protein FDP41_001904 [Naegleria fowleri]KAF0978834.1 hypothetical protein FDP41_001904 [Naegleria fowleri]